jgi:asparaginyl-tRNA synthetase
VVAHVLKTRRAELAVLERDVTKLEKIVPPFPRLTYEEASRILLDSPEIKGTDLAFQPGEDFGAPHETIISNLFDRPVMVHRYPAAIKAFYMKRDPLDPTKCLSVDVLGSEGVGEIIGGSQREDELQLLLDRIEHEKLPQEAFQWYLDLRRYGSVPHGGFGLGLERTVAWICGIEHVREAIPFPRTIYRLTP